MIEIFGIGVGVGVVSVFLDEFLIYFLNPFVFIELVNGFGIPIILSVFQFLIVTCGSLIVLRYFFLLECIIE